MTSIKSFYLCSIMLIVLLVSGCVSEETPYGRGYEAGLQGNETVYNTCMEYHKMFWDNHVIECSMSADTVDNDTFQYSRGYIHGYNSKLKNENEQSINNKMNEVMR